MADSENADHIAIVYPVTSQVPVDFDIQEGVEAHCTLIYLGKASEVSYTKEDVQAILDRIKLKTPSSVVVRDLELFGPDKDVLVMTLDDTALSSLRKTLERALLKIGAKSGSEFKEYKPHVTLDSKTNLTLEEARDSIALPDTVSFDDVELWWGDE